MLRDLLDLMLPADCPCTGPGPLCALCQEVLAAEPRPARPTPAPAGLPECVALGEYAGRLRDVLLAYKEHGRRDLAAPLGDRLATGVAALSGGLPVTLIPVPATAAAARARSGDHMTRLARRAAVILRQNGRRVALVRALTALPRPDSAGLTATQRAEVARGTFRPRSGVVRHWLRRRPLAAEKIILVDDVLTTGSTLAAATDVLRLAGLRVDGAAVIAATRRLRTEAIT